LNISPTKLPVGGNAVLEEMIMLDRLYRNRGL
jgi:hypothetical protein